MFSNLTAFIFASAPAEFASKLPLGECITRLQEHIPGYSLKASGVIGRITHSRVKLSVRIPFFGNGFKTYFFGRFSERDGETILAGRFSMHPFAKGFLCVWFGFCLLWTVMAAIAVLLSNLHDWFVPLIGVAMLFFGYSIVRSGQWLARNDAKAIADTLTRLLQRDDHAP